ncbi:MAG TPA: M56 family metallopeptidase [Armatimonadota bacterium]|nr:M56 family metallopeptidase [Armatimonadota bacterium]
MKGHILYAAIAFCQDAGPLALLILIRSTLALALGLLLARAVRDRRPAWTSPVLRATLACCAVVAAVSLLPAGTVRSIWSLPPAEPAALQAAGDLSIDQTAAPAALRQTSPAAVRRPAVSQVPMREPEAPERPVIPVAAWACLLAAAAWVSISLALLARLVASHRVLARLHRDSSPVPREAGRILAELCRALRIAPLELRQSEAVGSPFLAGLRRPTIYLPADPDSDDLLLRAVLRHELAHYRRRDIPWRLACQILWAAIPFQPLLWLLRREMERSSEDACDREVVESGCPAPAYATCLLRLAEKWLPSEPQPLLAAGVVPIRSNLGQRIYTILKARPAARFSTRARITVFAGALAVTAAVALLISTGSGGGWRVPHGYLQHFTLAQREGWSIGPVEDATKARTWLGRPYPCISPAQAAIIRECVPSFASSPRADWPPDSRRILLDRLVKSHPHAFYPELELADWYLLRRDTVHYWQWLDTSLRDAPAVLAGRVQDNDGRPIAAYQVDSIIKFRRPKPAPLTGRLPGFPYVVHFSMTDSDGCYYIPTYRVPCSEPKSLEILAPGGAWAEANQYGFFAQNPPVAWPFVIPTRVGVLPPQVARPLVRLHATPGILSSSWLKPFPVRGAMLHLSWDPYRGATNYHVSVQEWGIRQGVMRPLRSPVSGPLLGSGAPRLYLDLPLSGLDPVLNRNRVYMISVWADRGRGTEMVSLSRSVFIRTEDALAPAPPTMAALNKLLGPDCRVTSLKREGGQIVVSGTCTVAAAARASSIPALLARREIRAWFPPDKSHPGWNLFRERLGAQE